MRDPFSTTAMMRVAEWDEMANASDRVSNAVLRDLGVLLRNDAGPSRETSGPAGALILTDIRAVRGHLNVDPALHVYASCHRCRHVFNTGTPLTSRRDTRVTSHEFPEFCPEVKEGKVCTLRIA